MEDEKINSYDKYKTSIENYLSGSGLERLFFETYNAKISAKEIFNNAINKKDKKYIEFIERLKIGYQGV